jgi:hypothetical protein
MILLKEILLFLNHMLKSFPFQQRKPEKDELKCKNCDRFGEYRMMNLTKDWVCSSYCKNIILEQDCNRNQMNFPLPPPQLNFNGDLSSLYVKNVLKYDENGRFWCKRDLNWKWLDYDQYSQSLNYKIYNPSNLFIVNIFDQDMIELIKDLDLKDFFLQNPEKYQFNNETKFFTSLQLSFHRLYIEKLSLSNSK